MEASDKSGSISKCGSNYVKDNNEDENNWRCGEWPVDSQAIIYRLVYHSVVRVIFPSLSFFRAYSPHVSIFCVNFLYIMYVFTVATHRI